MVGRQVKLYRNYRDVAILQRPLVGILTIVKVYKFAREPIIFTPLWVLALIKFFNPCGLSLAAYLDAFNILFFELWEVYVQYHAFGQAVFNYLLRDLFYRGLYRFKISIPAVIKQ